MAARDVSPQHSPPTIRLDDVAGGFPLDAKTAARKLGRTAFDVWTALLWRRDSEGFTRARNSTLTEAVNKRRAREGRKPTNERAIRRATSKLIKIGLLEVVGQEDRRVVVRQVFGDYRQGQITIPRTCARGILELQRHGGARAGSGRPTTTGTYSAEALGKSKRAALEIKTGSLSPSDALQLRVVSGGKITPGSSEEDRSKNSPRSSSKEEDQRSRAAGIFSFQSKPGKLRVGERMRERVNRDRWTSGLEDVKPPTPTAVNLKVAKIPAPLDLPDDMPDLDAAHKLISLYRQAIERKYGERCLILAGVRDLRKSKRYQLLVDAAHTMRDLSIAPAAWISWAIEYWRGDQDRGAQLPPLGYVFSTRWMVEKIGQFRRDGELATKGGRLVFNAKQQEVLRRWQRWEAARRRTPVDATRSIDEQERELVERFFPGGWQRYYEEARARGAFDSVELLSMRDEWLYIWD